VVEGTQHLGAVSYGITHQFVFQEHALGVTLQEKGDSVSLLVSSPNDTSALQLPILTPLLMMRVRK